MRGKLDTLQGLLLDAQCAADADGARGLVGELGEALELTRALVGAEVTGRPLASWKLAGLDAAELRYHSHHTHELYGVPFMFPSVRQGPVVARAVHRARLRPRSGARALRRVPRRASERADLEAGDESPVERALPHDGQVRRRQIRGRALRPGPVKGWKPPKEAAN